MTLSTIGQKCWCVQDLVEGQDLLVLLLAEDKDPNQQFINCTLFKTSKLSRFSKNDHNNEVHSHREVQLEELEITITPNKLPRENP